MKIFEFIKKILVNESSDASTTDSKYNEILRYSARLGGTLFGPIPENHNRQFFCLDSHTWVWHDDWVDEKGKRHIQNFQYKVSANSIIKIVNNNSAQQLNETELDNFYQAVKAYADFIPRALINLPS